MKAIGGYFELEMKSGIPFHKDAIRLNTGRNALEYILTANRYKKIFLPFFTCDVLLQPIKKLNIEYEFYSINEQLEPIFEFGKIKSDICFLYTNYFGLKDNYISNLSTFCKNLIIDNAQSFYSKPEKNIDTFYSARKFFGVPDGAYLYSNKLIGTTLQKDYSFTRFDHLLKRIDLSAENGYSSFAENEKRLDDQDITEMSELTDRILKSVDYKTYSTRRLENYKYIHFHLKTINRFELHLNERIAPMCYPFWADNELRTKLIQNKIFVAKYWPNVYHWCESGSLEVSLTDHLIHLPIDHRQTKIELDRILEIIKKN